MTSQEYLFARRGWRLALNMVDVAFSEYIRPKMVDAATAFIDEALKAGRKLLIHCNQGGSRAPGLALHWMRHHDIRLCGEPLTFEDGEALFKTLYPLYAPAEGIRGYVRSHWGDSNG